MTKSASVMEKPYVKLALSAASLTLAILAFGLPNHPYQWFLSIWLWILMAKTGKVSVHGALGWAEAAINVLSLACLLKLFLSAGIAKPLAWMQIPSLVTEKAAEGSLSWIPKLSLQWMETSASTSTVDLTVFQTFLLLVTVFAGIFRFQPFASLSGLFLVLVSLPSFLNFQWSYVLPALLVFTLNIAFSGERQA